MNGALPLFNEDCSPGDWWHIRAPGGYEWRRFDAWRGAEAPNAAPLHCSIIFSQGWPLNAEYARRYQHYRRRPTIHPPPQAGEFPAVSIRVHQDKRLLLSNFLIADSGEFRVSESGAEIRVRESSLLRGADGVWQIKLHETTKNIAANLLFRPSGARTLPLPPRQFNWRPPPIINGLHRWLVGDGLFTVTGEIRINDQSLLFTGRGICDHQFGTTPLLDLRHWIRGIATEPDRAIFFQFAAAKSGAQQACVVQIDADGITELEGETFATQGRRFTSAGFCYPTLIRVAGRVYAEPQRIDQSPASITVQYQAQYQHPVETASPLICEIASPSNLTRRGLLSRFFPFPA